MVVIPPSIEAAPAAARAYYLEWCGLPARGRFETENRVRVSVFLFSPNEKRQRARFMLMDMLR